MPRKSFAVFCLLITTLFAPVSTRAEDSNKEEQGTWLKALDYRPVGPARGGRVTAVAGVTQDPFTFYMGATGGGVWKTSDGGETWVNLSDQDFAVGSIGAVAVAPSDPNIIYVGTGSACPRGNVSPGNGVYASRDGGQSWTHLGLERTRHISRIEIDPSDPETVFVAALGNVFGSDPERGIYRSRNGGRDWEKVLSVGPSTGAADMAMDPTNPRILFAGMWTVERKPWTLIDGGPEGGLYTSRDGGDTWKKVEGGLPQGVTGRIGVTASPARPGRVWVIVETLQEDEGGVYRSDDGGKSFQRVNGDRRLRQRAWYYNHIYADTQDENTVYVLNVSFLKSIDGGANFEPIEVPHADTHDLWIHPHNNQILINGNDGGATVSFNGGSTWSTQFNQPTAEFYRVTVDNRFPYRLYGAQQDNSTISVPSRSSGDISPIQEWFSVGGGESGHIAVDPEDSDLIYAGNYIGQLTRTDRSQGHTTDISIYPQMHDGVAPRDIRYRFQWNAPIRISPHDPDVLYHTSQFVHRSRDEGRTWETISPDLTSDKDAYQDIPGGPVQHDHTGVELYTTIFSFEESPLEPGVLWAGSDDGLVHLSRDNGETWQEVTPSGMPAEGTVNSIEISRHDPAKAYLSVYRYRRNDFQPYIFVTRDYGESWNLLTDGENGIPEDHFVRVTREDPEREGLLFAGTEFGIYVSYDEGGSWQSLQLNLPRTPVTDLVIHQNDLVVATQGRSFWILDELPLLRQLDSVERPPGSSRLFRPQKAYRTQLRGFGGVSVPEDPFPGVEFHYYLPESSEELSLEILDPSGALVDSFQLPDNDEGSREEETEDLPTLSGEPGLHRFGWNLRYPEPDVIPGSIFSLSRTRGPEAPPGSYEVRLQVGETHFSESFEIAIDPRWETTAADLQAQWELATEIGEKLSFTHDLIRRIRSIREQGSSISERAVAAGHGTEIQESWTRVSEKLTALEEELIQTRNQSRQDPINFPPMLDNQLANLYSNVISADSRPNRGAYQRFEDLKAEIEIHAENLREIEGEELARFLQELNDLGVERMILPDLSRR